MKNSILRRKLMMMVVAGCAVLCMNVAQAKVADVVSWSLTEESEVRTNGYDSVQAAVDATLNFGTNRIGLVRLLADCRETIKVSGGGGVCISLESHVLMPPLNAPNGEVLVVECNAAPTWARVINGRLAGNVIIHGGDEDLVAACGGDKTAVCNVGLDELVLGDNFQSENGQIIAGEGKAYMIEFGRSFIGNCTEEYGIAPESAVAAVGAKFAANQGALLLNSETIGLVSGDDSYYVAEEPEMEIVESWKDPSNWMSHMRGQTPISRLVMLSSHDSGMDTINTYCRLGMIIWPHTVTQYLSYEYQLHSGARCFDLRPSWNDKDILFRPSQWWTWHGDNGSISRYLIVGWGAKLMDAFAAAKSFLKDHPTECVFMELSHPRGGWTEWRGLNDCVRDIVASYSDILYKASAGTILNEVPLGELRGKVILIVDGDDAKDKGVEINPAKGVWGVDTQEGVNCGPLPGTKGGYLYLHEDYANQDIYEKVKEWEFSKWRKQTEYVRNGLQKPEGRAFAISWQMTMQNPKDLFTGEKKGFHISNHVRAVIMGAHLEEDMKEAIVDNQYIRPMFVGSDYVSKNDFRTLNAYNECCLKSGARVDLPSEVWADLKHHPSVRFSISVIANSVTNLIDCVHKGYESWTSHGGKLFVPCRSFDMPFECLGENKKVLVSLVVPPNTKDIEGNVIESQYFTIESVEEKDYYFAAKPFPMMVNQYIDHDADGKELIQEVRDDELTSIAVDITAAGANRCALEEGKKYVVIGDVTAPYGLSAGKGAWILLPDGQKLTVNGGIHVASGSSLAIYGQCGGSGALYATGGENAAGIGGANQGAGGTVTVHGGTVTATGGKCGAGIGGGRFGNGGSVTIYGGTVTATSDTTDGWGAAGIGGGYSGSGGSVTIFGGTVTATGGRYGAGIGGCIGGGGSVRINGGRIVAVGGEGGAGIGGGGGDENLSGTVTINGGEVTATGGMYAAGIGGGKFGSFAEVTVKGGKVMASGGYEGAGVGTGTVAIDIGVDKDISCGTVMVNGGEVTATGGEGGAGIGGGLRGYAGDLTINGGKVIAIGGSTAAIGRGGELPRGWEEKIVFGETFVGGVRAGTDAEHTVFISKTDYANEIKTNSTLMYVEMPMAALRIPQIPGVDVIVSNGLQEVAAELQNGTNTYTMLPGDMPRVYFTPQPCCVFMKEPKSNPIDVDPIADLTVIDSSDLPTAGVPYLAWNDERQKLTETVRPVTQCEFVTDATEQLADGWYVVVGSVKRSAGLEVIGNAHLILGDGCSFAVTGQDTAGVEIANTKTFSIYGQAEGSGKLAARGGASCAGIDVYGSGLEGGLTINGGTVTATGGNLGAGIGGGSEEGGGRVTINGGTVTAHGNSGDGTVADLGEDAEIDEATGYGAGIGGGANGDGGTVTINGGTVNATSGSILGCGIGPGSGDGTQVGAVVFGAAFEGGVSIRYYDKYLREFVDEFKPPTAYRENLRNGYQVRLPVKDTMTIRIPRIEGVAYTVSNALKRISSDFADGTNTYVVFKGDSPKLYFTLGRGCEWVKAPEANPQVIGPVLEPMTIGVDDLPVAKRQAVAYLDWDEASQKLVEASRAASECEVVWDETAVLTSGWYVVDHAVENTTGGIEISGDVHLILCDGASLTVAGEQDRAAIDVSAGNSLTIYGQAGCDGLLVAKGDVECSGIGGASRGTCGEVTINGGTVRTQGGISAKGIGSGYLGDGGSVRINGGRIVAIGGAGGAGIGGGFGGAGCTVTFGASFVGGVFAGQSEDSGTPLTPAIFSWDNSAKYVRMPEAVAGVCIPQVANMAPYVVSNGTDEVIGVSANGTNSYLVSSGDTLKIYFASLSSGFAYVTGPKANPMDLGTVTEVKIIAVDDVPTAGIPYRNWDAKLKRMTTAVLGIDAAYEFVTDKTATLSNGWYVVNRAVENATGGIAVRGNAHLILCDGASLSVQGARYKAGIEVCENDTGSHSLTIYGQDGGTGSLVAHSGAHSAGIGGSYWGGRTCGTVTINGGQVAAYATEYGAGIGGANQGNGGTVTINGGLITAKGNKYGADIGAGASDYDGGTVTINGGTLVGGTWGMSLAGAPVIDGGSVHAKSYPEEDAPRNSKGARLYRVTVKCGGLEGPVNLEGLANYGTNDIFPVDGKAYLWLANGTYEFKLSDAVSTFSYRAVVDGRDITVEAMNPLGFFVNGTSIGSLTGEGWKWESDCLTFAKGGLYVLSGSVVNNTLQIRVDQTDVTVVLSNAFVTTRGRPAMTVCEGAARAQLLMTGGLSCLSTVPSQEEACFSALAVEQGADLSIAYAEDADILSSMLVLRNYGESNDRTGAAISGNGIVKFNGGQTIVMSEARAFDWELPLEIDPEMVMTAGDDSDEVRYVTGPGAWKCVTVAPAREVRVPQVSRGIASCVVSNGTEQLAVSRTMGAFDIYKVMLYDDVFIHFAVEPGMRIESENPLAIYGITHDTQIDDPTVVAPISPGEPFFCDTAAAATNVAKLAFLEPSAEVLAILDRAGDGAHDGYRQMFRFVVRPVDGGKYVVVAELTPQAQSDLAESADAVTTNLNLAAIAVLPAEVTTNLVVSGGIPGFYYSLYDGATVTNLTADADNLNALCNEKTEVVFPAVEKPSEAAGFFSVGASATDGK